MALKLRVMSQWPAAVVGSSPVTVTKENGIYTVGLLNNSPIVITGDPPVNVVGEGGNYVISVDDPPVMDIVGTPPVSVTDAAGVYTISVANPPVMSVIGLPPISASTAAGTVTIQAADPFVLTDKDLTVNADTASAAIPPGTFSPIGVWTGAAAQFNHGSIAVPITTHSTPSLSVHRVENIGTIFSDGNDAAAVTANIVVSGLQQGVAVSGRAWKTAGVDGDVVGLYGACVHNGATGYAFGAFTTVAATTAGTRAYGFETNVVNLSGISENYSFGYIPRFVGIDVPYHGNGTNYGGAALWVRHASPGSATPDIWDIGLLVNPVQVRTATIQDDSSSTHILRATAAHTNGINLSSATFSGSAFSSPGFSVSGTGNVTCAGQIVFPAAQNASANANTLDDYEEGTFTPALTFGGGAVGAATATGAYTKIGNRVFFDVEIILTAVGASTGAAIITLTGLPVSATPTTAISIAGNNLAAGVITSIQAVVGGGSNVVTPYQFAAGSVTALTHTAFANTSSIRLAGHYRVA